jgi:hypothetical protein
MTESHISTDATREFDIGDCKGPFRSDGTRFCLVEIDGNTIKITTGGDFDTSRLYDDIRAAVKEQMRGLLDEAMIVERGDTP